MKLGLSRTLALVSLGFTTFAVTPVHAQTTANGPYYAVPAWDQTLPVATRFIVLSNMNSQAVLDRETGLVWERSPDTNITDWGGPGVLLTDSANFRCNTRTVGNRKGWRLPTFQELASLVDPAVPFPGPTLPPGHPFTNVESAGYWSASTDARDASRAWLVGFDDGSARIADKNDNRHFWCVRGGQGVDPQ